MREAKAGGLSRAAIDEGEHGSESEFNGAGAEDAKLDKETDGGSCSDCERNAAVVDMMIWSARGSASVGHKGAG